MVELSHLRVVLILILAVFGLGFSRYFRGVHTDRIISDIWWMPKIFRMANCRCDEIVETEFGLKFGRSNAEWGSVYYIALFILVIANLLWGIPSLDVLLVLTLLACAYSIYLAWGLFVLKVACPPCLGTHLVNLLIFLIILLSDWGALFKR